MGARFTQYTAHMEAGGASTSAGDGVERFIYVHSGQVEVYNDRHREFLGTGGYAFLPLDGNNQITCQEAAQLIVFEKRYIPLDAATSSPASPSTAGLRSGITPD